MKNQDMKNYKAKYVEEACIAKTLAMLVMAMVMAYLAWDNNQKQIIQPEEFQHLVIEEIQIIITNEGVLM